MSCMNGDPVQIEFASADASVAAAITIKDANMVTRTLLASERLMIDALYGECAAAVTLLEVFNDTNADGNVDANERIAAFGANSGDFIAGEDGYPCRVGLTPKAKASGAGVVRINGTGRIVRGLGGGTRPTWKESETKGQ